MSTKDSWTSERARYASFTRSRAVDDPELIESRRRLRGLKLEEHVERVLGESPPLTVEQRTRIAQLLAPSVIAGGDM